MKKKLLSLLTLALLVGFLAPPASAQKISVGLKGGINYATMTDLPSWAEPNIFFVGGGFMVARLTNNLSLMPELLYSGKGFDVSRSGAEYLSMAYLEVPVLLRFSPNSSGRSFVPFGMLGPSLAVQVSCTGHEGDASADCSELTDDLPAFNDIDYGVTAGIGSDFLLEHGGAFSIDARYTYGLAKVWDPADWHHSVFSIMVGYRFGTRTEQVALKR